MLNKQQIGIRDDFFQLGGQSLKAAALVSRIHKKLNVELPLSEVFSYPTVESMAVKLMSLKEHVFTQIEPAGQREVYPLSFSQNDYMLFISWQMTAQAITCPLYLNYAEIWIASG